MNNWNDYYFIYKDAFNRWNEAKNPVFIAEHKMCKAIKKKEIKNLRQHLNNLNKEGIQ